MAARSGPSVRPGLLRSQVAQCGHQPRGQDLHLAPECRHLGGQRLQGWIPGLGQRRRRSGAWSIVFRPEEAGQGAGEESEGRDAGDHDHDPRPAPGLGPGDDIAVADGRQRDDPPPQGVASGGELGVRRVLSVVSDEGAGHDHPARHQGNGAQPLQQAARSLGRNHQAGEPRQAEHDDELARLSSGDQEPGGGGDHDEEVEPAEPGPPVAVDTDRVHHVVRQEHEPGDDANHNADPPVGLGDHHQRQDCRDDDRHLHPGVERLTKPA
jgi:hypothetical protein